MKKYILIFLLSFFGYGISFAADTSTIAAYYPSPFGSYIDLRSDQMSIGSGYRATALPTNGLIVQGLVGIGTSNPNYQVDVNGNAAANDVWVRNKGRWLSTADIFVN